MPTSEARIQANRRNAALSTGPKTEEGKARSRVNALKHGMTGAGIVLPEADAAEVARRAVAFARELNASDEVGRTLARRAALSSVRMERGADQETAALAERVRQVEADFTTPVGVDEAEAELLRTEAARIAMFDPSKEATLARRYEAAAERAFFHCLKELRQREKDAKADLAVPSQATLGSFSPREEPGGMTDAEFDAIHAKLGIPRPRFPLHPVQTSASMEKIDLAIPPLGAVERFETGLRVENSGSPDPEGEAPSVP